MPIRNLYGRSIFNLIFLFNLTAADHCKGVFLSYYYGGRAAFSQPRHLNRTRQPYRFDSVLTIVNHGPEELESWRVFVGFRHGEFLVYASNAELAVGSAIPGSVANGAIFVGYPMKDLKTAAAGDLSQSQVEVKLVGTQFGVAPPEIPLPSNLFLANDGFSCPRPILQGKRVMQVCCVGDPNFKINTTIIKDFLPPQNGDLSITYDVINTDQSSYWARVSISIDSPNVSLHHWKLSWEWQRQEFINAMKGANPSTVNSTACKIGRQALFYRHLNFSNVLNCETRPSITDLPQMDPMRSISMFLMEVYKMPPDLGGSRLTPPRNWRIDGTRDQNYKCGHPVRMTPGDREGLTSLASWKVMCDLI